MQLRTKAHQALTSSGRKCSSHLISALLEGWDLLVDVLCWHNWRIEEERELGC